MENKIHGNMNSLICPQGFGDNKGMCFKNMDTLFLTNMGNVSNKVGWSKLPTCY